MVMSEKQQLYRKIWELDFAIHELVLYLDTHPQSKKAMELLEAYRNMRMDTVKTYESKYGVYVKDANDVPPDDTWNWIKSPWPWENDFGEEK